MTTLNRKIAHGYMRLRAHSALLSPRATLRRSTGLLVVFCILAGPAYAAVDPWADQVVDADAALDASGLYNDPQAVLGAPTTTYFAYPVPGLQFMVSVVTAPFNLDAPDGNKVITTINTGQFIKLRFAEPVEDDPRNPFGIDLIVFGNSFFVGPPAPATPDADMETLFLAPALFAEPVTIAVSQSGIGNPMTDPDQWYVYGAGPFADGPYPSNAYAWDRDVSDWGDPSDPTTPVDPSLTIDRFGGRSAADAIDLYECSGGGTGFDLSASGFSWIRYVYLTSNGGEVDALADVFASLGDFDRDGDVDLSDFAAFQNCFDPMKHDGFPCECRGGDFDGGHEVDLADHATMATFITGPR